MRVVTPGEIPPRDEAPVNNALHHLRCAFAGYKAELEERHWAVVGAHALASHEQSKRPKTRKVGPAAPLLEAIQREIADLDAAQKLCEKLLVASMSSSSSVAGLVALQGTVA